MIVVSHRGPFGFSVGDDGVLAPVRGPGGLAGTLHLLATTSAALGGARCISAALGEGDRAAADTGTVPAPGTEVQFVTLDPELHRLHYEVVSNQVLWFCCHGIFDLPRAPTFDRAFGAAWEAYVAVNREFADAVIAVAAEGETVLVQDYPVALVPGMLAATRPDLRIAYFAHTPFCDADGIRVLPEPVASALCSSLAARPCGFHTARWARAFEAAATEVLGPGAGIAPTFASPLGPDPDGLAAVAASDEVHDAAVALDDLVGDRRLVFRADRVDLTKNIARGFEAYDALLDAHAEWRERVVFVARLTSSRATLPEYAAYAAETTAAAERVNERWGRRDWQPVVVDGADDFARTVAGFTRYDVLVVNPIKDGLNLVAKEGPLVNRRDGVLCLSREAGSFEELRDDALAVHPYDVEQTAEALHTALSMPRAERAGRADRLRALAALRTPRTWLDDVIAHAR